MDQGFEGIWSVTPPFPRHNPARRIPREDAGSHETEARGCPGRPCARLQAMGSPWSLLVGTCVLGLTATNPHPLDGPDVDLRLWVEAESVSAHVVLNLAFVDGFLEIPREDEMLLRGPEHDLAADMVFELLSEHLSVAAGSLQLQPQLAGFEVIDPNFDLLAHFPRFGTRAMQKLRMTLEFPLETPPSEVRFTWSAFADDPILSEPEDPVPMDVIAHLSAGGVRTRVTLKASDPTFIWRGLTGASEDHFEDVPVLAKTEPTQWPLLTLALVVAGATVLAPRRAKRPRALLAAGVACFVLAPLAWNLRTNLSLLESGDTLPSHSQAKAVFEPLHTNLYRAFDFTNQSDVYDSLARSVHGNLLDELYNQIHGGLVMQEEGGAVSEVQDLRLKDLLIESVGLDDTGSPTFSARCQWEVDGAVFHSNHSHWRTNQYEARYGVAATASGWRIVDHEILAARRVDAGPILPQDSQENPPPIGESF